MTKISIVFDTETKENSVSINGQLLPNVQYVNIGRDYDNPEKSYIDITMKQEMPDEKMVVYTNITASERNTEAEVKDIEECVTVDNKKMIAGAYAMLGKKVPK